MKLQFDQKSQNMTDEITTKIALFKGKEIRKTLKNGEWWFSVVDVVEALTDSDRPSVYWTAMKARVSDEGDFQLSTICRQLKLKASDGKKSLGAGLYQKRISYGNRKKKNG